MKKVIIIMILFNINCNKVDELMDNNLIKECKVGYNDSIKSLTDTLITYKINRESEELINYTISYIAYLTLEKSKCSENRL